MERRSEAPSSDHTILSIATNAAAAPTTVLGDGSNNNSIGNTSSEVSSGGIRSARWTTIDGPLGLSEEESLGQARKFFRFGFLLLPWLWAVNCLYFWPVLRKSSAHSHPQLRYCKPSSLSCLCIPISVLIFLFTFGSLMMEWF